MMIRCLPIYLGAVFFLTGAQARPVAPPASSGSPTSIDFRGMQIQGEVRNPGEFYFEHRPEEKFDSLVKRRKDFHRELMRDAVLAR
jgi:hypothetical protein